MTGGIRILRELELPLRDGAVTRTEVWLGDQDEPRPAILVRTPYGKESAAPNAVIDTRMAVSRGYAVVLQDVRGRGTSDGVFEPFVNEEADGVDSVEWVAAQDWCDGRVVMCGMSYVGATQWLAAAGRPPALRAIAPVLSSDDYGEGWSFTDGVPEIGFLTTWSAAGLADDDVAWYEHPEMGWQDRAGLEQIAPWTAEWLSQPVTAPYWRARSIAPRREDVAVPVMVVAGWHDVFLRGSLASFARSRDPRDRLVIGPWSHDEELSHIIGDAHVGVAGAGVERLFGWILDFYDAALANREPAEPRVRAYALGDREWIDLPAWPPPAISSFQIEVQPGAFEVDPDEPVPTLGGRCLFVGLAPTHTAAVRDQRVLADRADVHVASLALPVRPTLLAGPVRARLAVQAGGPAERMWTATLCVEHHDGALHNLADGVTVAAGDRREIIIELGDICVGIGQDERLVLLVAGSSFPRWPRPQASGTRRIQPGSYLELTAAPARHSPG